jgi:hypothetical protein
MFRHNLTGSWSSTVHHNKLHRVMPLKSVPTVYNMRLFSPLLSWSSRVSSSTLLVKERQTWTAVNLDPFYHFYLYPCIQTYSFNSQYLSRRSSTTNASGSCAPQLPFKWITARHTITLRKLCNYQFKWISQILSRSKTWTINYECTWTGRSPLSL